MHPIYLDYAATTPVDPRVAEKLRFYLTSDGVFANPSSDHVLGHVAKQAVEVAREEVAALIKAEAREIIWTSGATEANNLAIKGAAQLYQRKGKHIVTIKTEHKTVLDSCQYLEKEGFRVTYLQTESNGVVDLEKFKAALTEETSLVSVMWVNNELGVIQDIQAMAEITAARGIRLHVDAVQAIGKLEIDVRQTPVDLMSFCAHKIYGPKGIGGLYIRRKPRVHLAAQIHGGGQEQGLRSGTLATHQIAAMGEAFRLARQELHQDQQKIQVLRARLLSGIQDLQPLIHGDLVQTVPNIINLRFAEIPANKLLRAMPEVALSTASACMQANQTSHVLRALGLSELEAKAAIRISFGRFTTEAEINFAVEQLHSAIGHCEGL